MTGWTDRAIAPSNRLPQTPEQTRLFSLLRRPKGNSPEERVRMRRALDQLAARDVDVRVLARRKTTPLDAALAAGNLEGVAWVLRHPVAAKPETHDERFRFLAAAMRRQFGVARMLVEEFDFPLEPPEEEQWRRPTLVHQAVVSAQPADTLPWLVGLGLSVNPDPLLGPTPLARALRFEPGYPDADPLTAVRTLLALGADPAQAGVCSRHPGGSVLHVLAREAPRAAHLEMWQLLAGAGADVKKPDAQGKTPLDVLELEERQRWERINPGAAFAPDGRFLRIVQWVEEWHGLQQLPRTTQTRAPGRRL